MKISLACDHGGLSLKLAVKQHLEALGHQVEDFGTHTRDSCDYSDFAAPAAQAAVLIRKTHLTPFQTPCLSLVGSRELKGEARAFARRAGEEMARQGYTLVSGGARGTDREGQEACLAAGGRVIAVLAAPQGAPPVPNLLLCWEDSFDLPFSPARALSRNRIIHILGEKTLVAQTSPGFGGTWNGTEENLRRGWSPVFFFDDGSPGAQALIERGATAVGMSQLKHLSALFPAQTTFF